MRKSLTVIAIALAAAGCTKPGPDGSGDPAARTDPNAGAATASEAGADLESATTSEPTQKATTDSLANRPTVSPRVRMPENPDIADAFLIDDFPALSKDGAAWVSADVDDDAARGHMNLTIRVFDWRSGAEVETFLILDADELDEFDAVPAELILSRLAQAEAALGRHEWVAFRDDIELLVTQDPMAFREPGAWVAHAADSGGWRITGTPGDGLVVVDDTSGRLWGALAPWRPPSSDLTESDASEAEEEVDAWDDDFDCYNPAFWATASVDTGIDAIHGILGYAGSDMCWEPDYERVVVDLSSLPDAPGPFAAGTHGPSLAEIPDFDLAPVGLEARDQARAANARAVRAQKAATYTEAIAAYRDALAAAPNFVLARSNLASALALSGDTERALGVLQQLSAAADTRCLRCGFRLGRAVSDPDFAALADDPEFQRITGPWSGVERDPGPLPKGLDEQITQGEWLAVDVGLMSGHTVEVELDGEARDLATVSDLWDVVGDRVIGVGESTCVGFCCTFDEPEACGAMALKQLCVEPYPEGRVVSRVALATCQ